MHCTANRWSRIGVPYPIRASTMCCTFFFRIRVPGAMYHVCWLYNTTTCVCVFYPPRFRILGQRRRRTSTSPDPLVLFFRLSHQAFVSETSRRQLSGLDSEEKSVHQRTERVEVSSPMSYLETLLLRFQRRQRFALPFGNFLHVFFVTYAIWYCKYRRKHTCTKIKVL